MQFPDFKKELEYLSEGYDAVIGCDEVGVGPIAGPVVAAACILDHKSIGAYRSKNKWYARVRDSKTTSHVEREQLLEDIKANSIAYGIGKVWQSEIDKINVHRAARKAMRLAIEDLLGKIDIKRCVLLVDGKFTVHGVDAVVEEQQAIISGDSKILSISAASIIAKVHRDDIMKKLDEKFPKYGFATHKGYGTKAHYSALKKFGPSVAHRKTFLKALA